MKIRYIRTIALGILLCAGARAQVAEQYRVKAAFLYNFAKFVEWPPQAFGAASAPIVIAVLGKNPFGEALVDTVAGKTFAGRAFQVRQITEVQQTAGCQIVFICSSERKRLGMLFAAIGNSGVLTVGEAENFAIDGGVINFKIENGNVRLQINMQAARKQQLRINPKLLSLAEIVEK